MAHPSRFLKGGITPPITDQHSSPELEPLLLSPKVGPPCASRTQSPVSTPHARSLIPVLNRQLCRLP